jgi:cytochrome P450
MAFTTQEGIIILANFLRAFRCDLVEGQQVMPQQRVTLRPRGGMKMHAKRRRSSGIYQRQRISL